MVNLFTNIKYKFSYMIWIEHIKGLIIKLFFIFYRINQSLVNYYFFIYCEIISLDFFIVELVDKDT